MPRRAIRTDRVSRSLRIINPTLEMDSDTAQVIKEQLKENLNIDIELKAQELQAKLQQQVRR